MTGKQKNNISDLLHRFNPAVAGALRKAMCE